MWDVEMGTNVGEWTMGGDEGVSLDGDVGGRWTDRWVEDGLRRDRNTDTEVGARWTER